MNSYWRDKLVELLRVQTNSENEKLMVLYLDKELRELRLDYTIDAVGNVLVTKGKATTYPCVVSHMDTVHNFVDNFEIYHDIDDKDILFSMSGKQRVGIGGDDKCGVFGCLYLLKTIPNIKVVFFSREECGCKGSNGIDKTFFADCRYLIQLDRRGSRDFIQTYWGKKTVSHEFSSEIGLTKKKYKFKNAIGTVTDVMKLWYDKVGVSCINLSSGYYKPHTAYEYVSVSTLWNSVKFIEEIISTMQAKKYVSLPPPPIVITIPAYNSRQAQCDVCYKYKNDAFLYVLSDDYCEYQGKKVCWSCKDSIKKKLKEGKSKETNITKTTQKTTQNETVVLACYECGVEPGDMKKGEILKHATDGHLYCNICMGVLFVSDTTPKKCFSCSQIIPKDHKIIERFGVRICEECALSSDVVIDDEVKQKHIHKLEQEN